MARSGYNVNTNRMQRCLFHLGKYARKIQQKKFLDRISDETIPKPKIRK